MSEMDNLRQAIAALEAQRHTLGNGVVDAALGPLRERLQALEGMPPAGEPAAPVENAQPALAEQRRLVTILFADLVGYTSLSERLDVEEVRDVADVYFKRWGAAIETHSGKVEKYMGDAILAVFGLQTASEQDPENAVRAALEMQPALVELNAALPPGIELHMRVGIHTGLVVISTYGEGSQRSYEIVGDAVNLASRLQNLAPVDGILISHDTYRHVRGVFDVLTQPSVTVKGKRAPVQVYIVAGAKPRAFRQEHRGVEGIETRMVGREAELARLQAAYKDVLAQHDRRVITLLGDAGIGKSRLLLELDDWLELQNDYYYFSARADPLGRKAPRGLVRDLLSNRFGIQDSDSPADLLVKIADGLEEVMLPETGDELAGRAEILMKARFIGWMAGFEADDPDHLRESDPRQVARRGVVYLVEYLRAMGQRMPLVVILEDLHWADDSSLDLLHDLDVAASGIPILVVCASRMLLLERRPDWGSGLAFHDFIRLQLLSPEDCRQLVDEIFQMADGQLPELSDLIVDSAGGNPFYVEELVKMLIEDGVIIKTEDRWRVDAARLRGIQIPSTLMEVLQARFDSLSPDEKLVLQRAAVVGRTFWDQVIEAISDQETQKAGRRGTRQEDFPGVLGSLQERELIYHQPESSFVSAEEYFFKHALMRDATYEGLLRRYRRVYHAQVAHWLVSMTEASGRTDEYAARIAEHLELAGEGHQAAAWFLHAGRAASGHYAADEALRLLGRGRELATPEQVLLNIDLLLEQVHIYHLLADRSQELAALETLDDWIERAATLEELPGRKAQALHMWALYHTTRGDYEEAVSCAKFGAELALQSGELVTEAHCFQDLAGAHRYLSEFPQAIEYNRISSQLGRQAGNANLEANGLFGLGAVAEIQADYAKAREYLEAALILYRQASNLLGESRVLNSLGIVLLNEHELEAAKASLEQSLEMKRLLGDRYGVIVVLSNLGTNAMYRYEFEEALKHFQETLVACQEIEDYEGVETALIGTGSCRITLGDFKAAQQDLEKAAAIAAEIGDRAGAAECRINQALLACAVGQPEQGLRLAELAWVELQEIQARSIEASASLAMGIALEQLDKPEEAFSAYQTTLQIREELGQPAMRYDAWAGLARLSLARGATQQAEAYGREILQAIQTGKRMGSEDLAYVYLSCYAVLVEGQPGVARDVLQAGYRMISEIAARVHDERLRRSYLEVVPSNRRLREIWEQQSR